MTNRAHSYAPAPNHDRLLSIGVPSIDREHRALIYELNRLISAPDAHPSSEPFVEVLSRLGPQISAHFNNEEAVLKSCGMSANEIADHVEAHTDILEQYARMNSDLMHGRNLARSESLLAVKAWIVDHLQRYDAGIAKYIRTAPPATEA